MIDTFDVADLDNQLFRLGGVSGTETSPRLTHDIDSGILGDERDVLITIDHPVGQQPLHNSIMGAIGRANVGALEIATAGVYPSKVEITYNGLDLPPATQGDGPSNAAGLGIGADLTDAGLSDRFRFRVLSAQTMNNVGLELIIQVDGLDGQVAFGEGVFFGQTQSPTDHDVLFSEFRFTNGGTVESIFTNAQSVKITFNPNLVHNADFVIDSIQTVPEPSTLALLGLAGAVGIVAHCRKRRA